MEFDLIPVPALRTPSAYRWRPPADIRVISADDHNMEMEHLWEERLPAKFKDRAPKLWYDEGTGWHMEVNGRSLDVPRVSNDYAERTAGLWNRDEKLLAMDAEGVEASLTSS